MARTLSWSPGNPVRLKRQGVGGAACCCLCVDLSIPLTMTYAGYVNRMVAGYTEFVSPNGAYVVTDDGVGHWTGSPITIGHFTGGGFDFDVTLLPSGLCTNGLYNINGPDATLSFNYPDVTLGVPAGGVGASTFYDAGTITYTL